MADFLSRNPLNQEWSSFYPVKNKCQMSVSGGAQCAMVLTQTDILEDPAFAHMVEAASADDRYQMVIDCIERDTRKNQISSLNVGHPAREFRRIWPGLSILQHEDKKLVLLEDYRIVVPVATRAKVIENVHKAHIL